MTSAIARLAERADIESLAIRPRFVATTGEMLTPSLRRTIEAFGAPIFDYYGCNEANVLAWQCPHGASTYHCCDDSHVIEVISPEGRPVGEGEWGEIVITSLFSYAMPMIRYRTGDIARRGSLGCPCGAAVSTLLAIGGRTIDLFALADGRVVHPWEILNAAKPHLAWVAQFQIVQSDRDELEMRVVPLRTPLAEEWRAAEESGRAVLAPGCRFSLRLVEAIASTPRGKGRPFVALASDRG